MIVRCMTMLEYRSRRSEEMDILAQLADDNHREAMNRHDKAWARRNKAIDAGRHVWPRPTKNELAYSLLRKQQRAEREAEIERRRKVWAMGPGPNGVPYGDSTFDLSRDW